ncbi:dual specificity phosphatase 29 [Columba livia]|uniref:dual specificity phosphatase 29 n=1 Tax=Columba livia TaxID=8932 RepID=UPI0031BA382C
MVARGTGSYGRRVGTAALLAGAERLERVLPARLGFVGLRAASHPAAPPRRGYSIAYSTGTMSCRTAVRIVTAHNRFVLWKMGVTHVLNAAHGTAYSHRGQDFYGATIEYYGVPAHDLPSFDISQFFFSAAQFIHNALNTPGDTLSATVFVRTNE